MQDSALASRKMKKCRNNLRALRKAQGLTLKALSEKAGVSHGAIGNYETGARGIGAETLHAIAEALGVSVDQVTGGYPEAETDRVRWTAREPSELRFDTATYVMSGDLSPLDDAMLMRNAQASMSDLAKSKPGRLRMQAIMGVLAAVREIQRRCIATMSGKPEKEDPA